MFVRCRNCVMPNTRPSTPFVDGVCSACINIDKYRQIDWVKRSQAFHEIIDKIPKNDSGYDVIVASSGGKDSTSQVIKLLQLGVVPLVVTARTCHLTDIGRANIDNLSRYATTIEYAPNARIRAKLNRLGQKLVGDISLPEHMAIFSTPFRAAVQLGINTIIYGEAPLMQYGGPIGSEEASTMTRRWISEHGGFLGMRPLDFVGMDGITDMDMREYMLPTDDKMKNITAYFLGQYFPWDSHENAEIAKNHGMVAVTPHSSNYWDHENLDNAQTGLHDWLGYCKYGYGRGCAQISIDIRNGRITRDQAMCWLVEHEGMFPYNYAGVSYTDIVSRIGMTEEEFMQTADMFTSKGLFAERTAYGRIVPIDICH